MRPISSSDFNTSTTVSEVPGMNLKEEKPLDSCFMPGGCFEGVWGCLGVFLGVFGVFGGVLGVFLGVFERFFGCF